MPRLPHRTPTVKDSSVKAFKRAVNIRLAEVGWSQSQLARSIGRGRTAVNRTLNSNAFPKVAALIRKELSL